MKRLLMLLFILQALFGCTTKIDDAQNLGMLLGTFKVYLSEFDYKSLNNDEELFPIENEIENEYVDNEYDNSEEHIPLLNAEEILNQDFSSIEGEYVNSQGDIRYLDAEYLQSRLLDVSKEKDYYFLNLKTEDGFGYALFVYDVGVEVPYFEGQTDITKIRISQGQDYPMYIEEIYYKK